MKWLLNAAATARLVRLVTEDEIARPVRQYIDGRWPESRLNYLVGCPYCVGVWAGLLVASGLLPRTVRDGLALAGASDAIRWAADVIESKGR